jgi:DNA-binding NarL/FixJ family response regulator
MTEHHIAIVDDHPLFRNALRHTLSDAFGDLKLSEAGSLNELVALLEKQGMDLILLDLNMPGVAGFSGLVTLRSLYPDTPVAVVSANESPSAIRRCLSLGASGYIPKSVSVDKIRTAIAAILRGEIWAPQDIDCETEDDPEIAALANRIATLTPQQMRVLTLLGEGLLNKQIAYNLGVSEATVKAHVSAVLQKLGVESRTQAVIAVQRIEDDIGENRRDVSGETV